MLKIYTCIAYAHDLRLVVLAALICVLASLAAINLLHHARRSQGHLRLAWLAVSAISTGFGIWATHFVAMLAFTPGIPSGYNIALTVMSLVAAMLLTGSGLAVSLIANWRHGPWLGGAIVAGGIAAMHYTGMAAFEVAGVVLWDPVLVAASIVAGAVIGAIALPVGLHSPRAKWKFAGAVLLTLAIVSHLRIRRSQKCHEEASRPFQMLGKSSRKPRISKPVRELSREFPAYIRRHLDGKFEMKLFGSRLFGQAIKAAGVGSALMLSVSVSHAQSGPFTGFNGSWSGNGTVALSDGTTERIRCKASYNVNSTGLGLKQTLRCASDSYKFDLSTDVTSQGNRISGNWSEASRNIFGTLQGTAGGGHIEVFVEASGFAASVTLRNTGNKQTVQINSKGEIRGVNITMSKGG